MNNDIIQLRQKYGIPTEGISNQSSTQNRVDKLQSAWGITSANPASTPNPSAPTPAESFLSKSGASFKASETGSLTDIPVNIAKTFGNVPSSMRDLVKTAVAPVNPFDINHPMNIGKNTVESAIALKEIISQQGVSEGLKSILGGFADTYLNIGEKIYGGLDKAYNALLDDPKKALADVATHISKIGIEDPMFIPTLLYGGTKTIAGKETDAISRLASTVTRGTDTSIPNVIDPLLSATKATIKGGKELVQTGVEKAKGLVPSKLPIIGDSEALIARVNKINPSKRKEFMAQQGVLPEQWLKDRGIISGREKTVTDLIENFQTMRKNVDEAIDKIPGNFRDQRITVVADESAQFAVATESKGAGRMSQLAEKAKGEGLTAPEINELKRFYEKNVKTGYKKDPTKTSEQVQRATNRDTGIRESLLEIADKNGFPNLREINKEIQASKFLSDEIAGKLIGEGGNNALSLTDIIIATPGLAIDPSYLAGFVGMKALKTETAKVFAAKLLAGFPKVKPIPRADLETITKRASEVLKRQEDLRVETQQAGILAHELQKAGFIMSEGTRGFITENPIPLSRNEQAIIRAAKNHAEQQQIVNYILEQRAKGNAVGEGFIIQDIDNVPILNPKTRFNEPEI